MVFKNKLFFSSKKSDTSSPDGSNSPRSIGSNSPIRSDKKKPKSSSKDESPTAHNTGFAAAACRQTQVKDGVKKKDSFKGKESAAQSPGRLGLSSSGSKKPASATAADGKNAAASVSPILASSLGLNKIKTRSGPLPQESFFSFRGDKGSGVLGSSNLSKPGVGGGVSGGSSSSSGSGKKKEIVGQSRMMGFQGSGVGDYGHNWDSTMSPGSGQSREVSSNLQAMSRLQNGESSAEAGRCESSRVALEA
ncbi:hypothetical protein GH714_000634 [Hevea brasiliensis]|uniref:Uncharacterized protein n=1 Tax=Hevea brasiliensis TaxID=3981 RepID=A0A6A6M9B5_HEVBR|nr:hypothetical protein GH714_000634 [Hevea brasiliensis]